MSLQPPYDNLPSAYFIHVHLIFQTWYNQPVLQAAQRLTVRDTLAEICDTCEYHLLTQRIRENRVELLLSLKPQHAISRVVQSLKANLSSRLFLQHPDMPAQMGKRRLWARSYKVETTGAATTAQVKAYIDDQRSHHQVERQAFRKLARYAAPDRASYQQFEHRGRAVYRLHYHLVLTTRHHQAVIDDAAATYLTETFLRLGDAKDIMMLSFDILDDHVHLLVAARPTDAPQTIAESLMNNSSFMTLRRFEPLRQRFPNNQLWIPGFFVRSLGRTTAQVKAAMMKSALSQPTSR